MSDKPVKVCPKCKARKVEKLISHTSFQLKGGGWYSDLYASQKPGSGFRRIVGRETRVRGRHEVRALEERGQGRRRQIELHTHDQ